MDDPTDVAIEAAMPTMMRHGNDADDRSDLHWYETWLSWAKSMPHQHRMACTCVRCEWEDVFAKTRDVLRAAQPTPAPPKTGKTEEGTYE